MARQNSDGTIVVGVVLGGLALLGLAAWAANNQPSPRAREAARIREQADRWLYGELVALSQSWWVADHVRHYAAAGAREFKRLWIDTGMSGSAIPSAMKIAIYGNWCGPRHGGGPCVDELDCLCREHDRAYAYADQVARGLAAA